MIRKSMIAFAAIAALSTALVSADALAKPNGGGGKGGNWGKGGGHSGGGWHHNDRPYGHNYGFYGVGGFEPDCYQIVTRRGLIRTICSY